MQADLGLPCEIAIGAFFSFYGKISRIHPFTFYSAPYKKGPSGQTHCYYPKDSDSFSPQYNLMTMMMMMMMTGYFTFLLTFFNSYIDDGRMIIKDSTKERRTFIN